MTSQSDYDSPWKDILDLFFESAMEFFFPQAHAQIDWSRGYEFLDKELLGTELRLGFSTAKLLDYADRWEELEQSSNPFALVTQAHLTALRTRDNAQDRLQ